MSGDAAPRPTSARTTPASPVDLRRERLVSALARTRPALPWISLSSGVATALLMDRGPHRAPIIASGALSVWLTLLGLQYVAREAADERPSLKDRAVRLARFTSLLLTQALVQLCLFFCAPAYYRAASLTPPFTQPGHVGFVAGLLLLCGLSLWDPWTEALLTHRYLAPVLPCAASFLALVVVLPGLGLSTQSSLWTAAVLAGFATALSALLAGSLHGGTRYVALLLGATLPAVLLLGGASVIPPAPLRLAKAEFGVELTGKWVTRPVEHLDSPPDRLICATAIAAPLSVKDQLFHEWRINGRVRARMRLDIMGGRTEGFRTRSWLRKLGMQERGEYACSVLTAAGQVLGTRRMWIGLEE